MTRKKKDNFKQIRMLFCNPIGNPALTILIVYDNLCRVIGTIGRLKTAILECSNLNEYKAQSSKAMDEICRRNGVYKTAARGIVQSVIKFTIPSTSDKISILLLLFLQRINANMK
uniref:Uncharacterized protein n=1 Tax=Strigamia maritima TaxID=126957 RepID=T1JDF0_STRMM